MLMLLMEKYFQRESIFFLFQNVSSILMSFCETRLISLFVFRGDTRKIGFFIVCNHSRNNRPLNRRARLTPFIFHSRRKPRISFVETNVPGLVHKCISRFVGNCIEMIQYYSSILIYFCIYFVFLKKDYHV